MKKKILYLAFVAIFFSVSLLTLPSIATAVPEEPSSEIPAGRGDPGYKPVERSADDTSMALITVVVFLVPVGGWFIVRSLRRSKKKP